MGPTAHRPRVSLRQLALFVLSMVMPCIVLIALGLRIASQQDELTDKHLADERQLRANEFERVLATRLERIALDPRDDAVALTATIADGRLILPWDTPATTKVAFVGAFASAVEAVEHEEFAAGRLEVALSRLDRLLAAATTSAERAYARLLRGRVLAKANRRADAVREYRALIGVGLAEVDEDGMPLALYAADRLLALDAVDADREAIDRIVESAAAGDVAPPAVWYLLRAVDTAVHEQARTDASRTHRERIAQRIVDVDHALSLQREAPALLAQWKSSDTAWIAHGTPLWLVGRRRQSAGAGQALVAVRADMLSSADSRTAVGPRDVPRIVSGNAAGEWLGDRFPGLKVSLPPPAPDTRRRLQRGFYAAALAVVLSVTLFGGYLLWRDVNREMQIAALRTQFVSSVSHELKTPLTAIRMFAETLQLDRVDAGTRAEYLDTIVNESERLTRLLNNVLDFSKIEEGRKAYCREPAALADIVRVAARAMAYPLEQHGFVLDVTVDDSLPAVDVDSDALEQAILNLLTNAMKYSGTGRRIDLRLAREGNSAVISVKDEGIGIPAADQPRIFERFYRAPTVENQRIPGTGLGLTLVDHIVKAHDGSVRVDSTPGRGSLFAIYLPLPAATPAGLAAEAV